MSDTCPCETIPVTLPEYPYDPFLVSLLPSGAGELDRERNTSQPICEIERVWEGWQVKLTTAFEMYQQIEPALEDAIRGALQYAHDWGRLGLTRVDPGEE